MTLSDALDKVYGHNEWHNPIRPVFVSGIVQSPYEAYRALKIEYQQIVDRLIGHVPKAGEV